MHFLLPNLIVLLVLFLSPAYAEPLNVKLGRWSIEPEKANNIKDRTPKYSCITEEVLASASRHNMVLSCTGTLLPTSNRTIAEWALTCPDGKITKWKMIARSAELIENFSTPLDYGNTANADRYSAKSIAKWLSTDCGTAPLFPKVK